MLELSDLPVHEDDALQDTRDFVDALFSSGNEASIVLILGQLDPLEMKDGQPRWTAEQITAIEEARDQLKSWEEDSDDDEDDEDEDDSNDDNLVASVN